MSGLRKPSTTAAVDSVAALVAAALADGLPRTAPEIAKLIVRRRDVVDQTLDADGRFLRVPPPPERSSLACTWTLASQGVSDSSLTRPERDASSFGPFEIVGLGLRPRDGVVPDFEGYQSAVHALAAIERFRQFWLGDLLNIGEVAFGELAAQVESELGLDYQTLANYRWVARHVPVSRRRESVSWSKHALVAPLDPSEQIRLLDQAEAEGLTVKELRAVVRGELPAPAQPSWTPELHDAALAVVEEATKRGGVYVVPAELIDALREVLGE